MGRYDEALLVSEQSVLSKPYFPEALWNKSILCFVLGNYEEGWQLFHYRWNGSKTDSIPLESSRPDWDGVDLRHKRVYVWAEQGVGDNVLYSAMLKNLEALQGTWVVACDHRLIPIFERSFPSIRFVDKLIGLPEDEYDQQIPIGDLGKWFRLKVDDFDSTRHGYLIPDPVKVAHWRSTLKQRTGLIVGLSWRSANKAVGAHKSINLHMLADLLALENVTFVNLQYDHVDAELESLPSTVKEKILQPGQLDTLNDLDNLLAVIEACDVIVTVSNTTAHLSGSVHKKTLLMLPFSQGKFWYWQPHPTKKGSLWYESTDLLTQNQPNQWTAVLEAVYQRLALMIEGVANDPSG
jgi:hypothetical protein